MMLARESPAMDFDQLKRALRSGWLRPVELALATEDVENLDRDSLVSWLALLASPNAGAVSQRERFEARVLRRLARLECVAVGA